MRNDDHEGSVRPTGWRLPLGVIIGAGLVSALLTNAFYGSLPILPWTMIPTLALLALGEGIAAYHTRRRIRRVPGTEPIEALAAARLVALAKASVLLASLAIGIFGGFALTLLDRLHAPAASGDALTAAGTLAAGAFLLAAALFLEYACRVPDDEDSDPSRPV
ncbi:DUF3180 domain-containing protein [Murinocardiopsis flavida]|nr:DUF3180 domain-containing protein [Murinocardiopsis flavida]